MRWGLTRIKQGTESSKNTNRVSRSLRPRSPDRETTYSLNAHRLFYRHLREPAMAVGHAAFDDVEEFLVQGASDWTCLAVSDRDLVDSANRCDLSCSAGEENFVGNVEHLARNHLLDNWEP